MSAGLHGAGPLGEAAERVLVERARSQGMRLIGPESLGLISTDPTVELHASLSAVDVLPGRVGFLTQSGTLGIAALEHARRVGLGISTFIDVGAKADVSGNDVLQFWEGDPRTDVVLLYLESFGNPRKFTRLARRLSRRKPIIAVKAAGATPQRLAPTVEGDPDWPADATIGALLSQSGVIRVDTPTELFDVARVIVDQPVPAGRRIAVISNSRGSSNLTLDACYGAGLDPRSPVDLTFAAGPESYEVAVGEALVDPEVDALLVVYAPPANERRREVGDAIARAVESGWQAGSRRVPVVATFLGAAIDAPLASGAVRIPLFEFPNGAARTLGRMANYGDWLAEPEGTLPEHDPAALDEARALVADILAEHADGAWLDVDTAAALLALCGLPMMPFRMVSSADEAVEAGKALGDPVVLKATGLERLSKSESGGVSLDVHGPDELRAAYGRMVALLGDAMVPAMVQCMAPSGVDVRVAAHQQPSYGAVISLGLGGSVALANPRRSVRVIPLTDADARRLIMSSPIVPLLADGAGEVDQAEVSALEDLLLQLAWAVEQLPELADVELNPVLAAGEAVSITAARVRVAPAAWTPDPEVRRLH